MNNLALKSLIALYLCIALTGLCWGEEILEPPFHYSETQKEMYYIKVTIGAIYKKIDELNLRIEKLEKERKNCLLDVCDVCLARIYDVKGYSLCEKCWHKYQKEGKIALHPSRYCGGWCAHSGSRWDINNCSFKNKPKELKKEIGDSDYNCTFSRNTDKPWQIKKLEKEKEDEKDWPEVIADIIYPSVNAE